MSQVQQPSNVINAQKYVNKKINDNFQVPLKTALNNKQQYISLREVITYSSNFALLFYVGANVFNTYFMANQNLTDKQKYLYLACSLYLTQIIYNYLDINSSTNIDKLESLQT